MLLSHIVLICARLSISSLGNNSLPYLVVSFLFTSNSVCLLPLPTNVKEVMFFGSPCVFASVSRLLRK